MVDSTQHVGDRGGPVAHMVGRGIPEEDERAGHEYGAGPFETGTVRQTDEHDARGQRQRRRHGVYPSPQQGLRPAVDVKAYAMLLAELNESCLGFACGDQRGGSSFGPAADDVRLVPGTRPDEGGLGLACVQTCLFDILLNFGLPDLVGVVHMSGPLKPTQT